MPASSVLASFTSSSRNTHRTIAQAPGIHHKRDHRYAMSDNQSVWACPSCCLRGAYVATSHKQAFIGPSDWGSIAPSACIVQASAIASCDCPHLAATSRSLVARTSCKLAVLKRCAWLLGARHTALRPTMGLRSCIGCCIRAARD